jgi:aspartyl-tRNA(Asn)/glutamyl-tRNA(Gln) amidotransferase subunit A
MSAVPQFDFIDDERNESVKSTLSGEFNLPGRSNSWFDLTPEGRRTELARCELATATLGPGLNALVATMPAKLTDRAPLAGLPYVAKDMFDRTGRRGEWGGGRQAGVASSDAAILRLLDQAGGSQIGVSSMTTLAYEPSGHNALKGRTKNPWHPDVISGGSSSGSAALVAAHCAHLGIGSDTGGSIRIPAACCGLVGLKPGWGALPTEGGMPLAPSLDAIGFMARTADDLIRTWNAVRPTRPASEDISSIAILSPLVRAASPVVAAAIDAALHVLSGIGIAQREVDDVDVIAEADRDALTIMQAEAARIHGSVSLDGDRMLERRIAKGKNIGKSELDAALARRASHRDTFISSWKSCDAAALPVLPMPAPVAAQVDPESPQFQPRTLYAISANTRFVNALGVPAIALPVGFDERGVPLSMQIIGRPGAELSLLKLAHEYQCNTGWNARVPNTERLQAFGVSA